MKLSELKPAELAFCGGASSFLQSDFWGNFKSLFGWKAYPFSAEWKNADGAHETLPLLVLYRRLSFGVGFAYIPWGPELPAGYDTPARWEASAELAKSLRAVLPKDTALIRFDFPWFTDDSTNSFKPFVRAAADVQPPDSVLVDLVPDEAAILGNMKSKWRYNVNLAGKKGVAVRYVDQNNFSMESGDLASYFKIYHETAERDKIPVRGMDYYRGLFDTAKNYDVKVQLYMASHEGEDIAGVVTLFRGKEAIYLYGASSNNKRNLMAPYALQWKVMQDAKAYGCLYYDLFGISPKPPEEDPNHSRAGLYRFKTGFIGDEDQGGQEQQGGQRPGGKIIHRPGSWDYPCRPLVYALYSAAEKTRKKIRDVKKRLKRR